MHDACTLYSMDGQSTVTTIVFSSIWTYSLTQPLRTAVKVGEKYTVHHCAYTGLTKMLLF